MSIYGYPNFSIRRAGLGNLLVMWARCEIFCRDNSCMMLAPQWTQPKLGPLLRREKDLRYYNGIFVHRPEYIQGFKRFWLAKTATRLDESKASSSIVLELTQTRSANIIEFWDEAGLLSPLVHEREFISKQLGRILSPQTLQTVEANSAKTRFIAAHVRRGDKPLLKPGEPIPPHQHWALPDEWFIRVIESIRSSLGEKIPVKIFSDARPNQLEALLKLPQVSLAGTDNAMADIMLLSQASGLITSGTSSFSMWAAYLGGMPTLWFPSLLTSLNGRTPWYDLETDAHGLVPSEFSNAFSDFISLKASANI